MSDQGDLFDMLPDPSTPRRGLHQRPGAAAETQIRAAVMVTPKTGTQRRLVLDLIAVRLDYGATDDEMQVLLDWDGSTQRPRRVELHRDGWIVKSEIRRRTRKGELAVVWVLSPAGREQHRGLAA